MSFVGSNPTHEIVIERSTKNLDRKKGDKKGKKDGLALSGKKGRPSLISYAAESAVAEYAVYAIPTYAITLWYHHGPQGETRYLTDPSGNIADTYRYDGYGIPISATNTYYNPHRYGGKYGYHSNLNPTGVILAGHRWYSPQLRRWMSRDPIAYQGGENLYAYVDDNPIGWIDPNGLDGWRFDWKDHGGPHFQREGSGGKQHRYRADNFQPLRHHKSLPPTLGEREILELRQTPAYQKWLRWRQAYIADPSMAPPRWSMKCFGVLTGIDLILRAFNGSLEKDIEDAHQIAICAQVPELCDPL